MDEYREKVWQFAQERSGKAFFNASPDHAAIIAENMFRIAEHDICIFTTHLAPRIYARESCVRWAQIFLSDDPEHQLRVICKESELETLRANPFFEAVKVAKNFSIRALKNEQHENIKQRFMLADDDCYRFEPNFEKCEAVAAFGNKDAKTLKGVFNQMWEIAAPVDVDNLQALIPELV